MTKAELEAIKAREKKATSSPWKTWQHSTPTGLGGLGVYAIETGKHDYGGGNFLPEDAHFIAHAREDILAMSEHIDQQGGRIEELEAEVKRLQEAITDHKAECPILEDEGPRQIP